MAIIDERSVLSKNVGAVTHSLLLTVCYTMLHESIATW